MPFSKNWDNIYKKGLHNSTWPWSKLIGIYYNQLKKTMDKKNSKILELGFGAGANIPFFLKNKVDYYGIEGSETITDKVKKKFKNKKIKLKAIDFTKSFYFKKKFDVIFDRGSLTCNRHSDIKKIIKLIDKSLKKNGLFVGIDWFERNNEMKFLGKKLDKYSVMSFTDKGKLADTGIITFYKKKEIYELFKKYSFCYFDLTTTENILKRKKKNFKEIGLYSFVVKKN